MNGFLMSGGIFFLIGAVLFVVGFVSTKRSKTAQSWPTTTGTVLNSDVKVHVDYDSDSGTSTTYEPSVSYQYTVMGQPYNGNRIAYGANRFGQKKAYEIVSKYPAASQVIVHYNPEKITESTLEVVARGGKAYTIVGIILAVGGLLFAVISLIP